ncbi:MAG: restriction endonuclease, partial [Cyclobacteriaceae bacterium]|nr:restriction endonuclease [Cyclobacteriaceae bacterium]
GGTINHAVRSMKWPGLAAVEVALVTIFSGVWKGESVLNQIEVDRITSYLDDQEHLGEPFILNSNQSKSFIGSVVNGKGFVIDESEARELIEKGVNNKDVIYPYLNGEDLNNRVDQSPSRWIINFFDWEEEKAKRYKACYDKLYETVKIERGKIKTRKENNNQKLNNDDIKYIKYWWLYARPQLNLYRTIAHLDRVLVVAQVSKTVAFTYTSTEQVISMMCVVFAFDKGIAFPVLQSSLHKDWVVKYGSALKNDTRYTPSDVFETFPFPENASSNKNKLLEDLGEAYFEFRQKIMTSIKLGLTKTYNQFHNKGLTDHVEPLEPKAFQKKYGKETWNLYNHLEVKKAGNISYQEAVPLIFRLRELHKEMDEAVLAAYGWHQDSEKWGKAIELRHDFYEVEYLPENDRVRYTIHPEARKEVLKRLLLLNHERYAEEVRQGLHDKKAGKNKALKKEATPAKKTPPPPTALFGHEGVAQKTVEVGLHRQVVIKTLPDGDEVRYVVVKDGSSGQQTLGCQPLPHTSQLAMAMLNRKAGAQFSLDGVEYLIKEVV